MKTFKYKKWFCRWSKWGQCFHLYTANKEYVIDCNTAEECKEFIDSYDKE